jgi:hypothetical protein
LLLIDDPTLKIPSQSLTIDQKQQVSCMAPYSQK